MFKNIITPAESTTGVCLFHTESFQTSVPALGLVALHLFPALTGDFLRMLCHSVELDLAFAAAPALALVGLGIYRQGAVGANKLDLTERHGP